MSTSSAWFGQSILSTLCLVPVWLCIGYFTRNYGIRPDVYLAWYMVGVVGSVICWNSGDVQVLALRWPIALAIVLIGLTVGGAANILLFRAVAHAPNPGLPIAIAGAATPCVFLLSVLLGQQLPKLFSPAKFDPWTLTGVLLAVAGTTILAVKR